MEGLGGQLPFILLMFVVIFFFMILPAQRRQKKEKNFMNNLKKGDNIITKSGIHAKVGDINNDDNTCVIDTQAGKIKIEKSAISLELSAKLQQSK